MYILYIYFKLNSRTTELEMSVSINDIKVKVVGVFRESTLALTVRRASVANSPFCIRLFIILLIGCCPPNSILLDRRLRCTQHLIQHF